MIIMAVAVMVIMILKIMVIATEIYDDKYGNGDDSSGNNDQIMNVPITLHIGMEDF